MSKSSVTNKLFESLSGKNGKKEENRAIKFLEKTLENDSEILRKLVKESPITKKSK